MPYVVFHSPALTLPVSAPLSRIQPLAKAVEGCARYWTYQEREVSPWSLNVRIRMLSFSLRTLPTMEPKLYKHGGPLTFGGSVLG